MDLTSSWFLALIVVLGGGVAILADHLGRTFGKKRLRWGKLRPKHTAILLTGLLGMFVTIFTIAVVAAISAEAREWIRLGRGAIKENQRLVSERDRLVDQAKRLTESQREASESLAERGNELALTNKQLKQTNQRLEEAKKTTDRAERQVRDLDRRFASIKSQVRGRQAELQKTQRSLSELRATFSKLRTSFEYLQTLRVEAEKQTEKLQNELIKNEQDLDGLKTDRDRVSNELKQRQRDLAEANERFRQAEEDLRNQLAGIVNELGQAESALSSLKNITDQSRSQPMIFARDEELTRTEIPGTSSVAEAENALRRALAATRRVASVRGAQPNTNGIEAGFIGLVDRNGNPIATPDEQFDAIVRRITSQPGPKLVVVYSLLNSFRGEFVAVDVRLFANPIVFRENEVLADTRIDGTDSEQQIFDQLSAFIRTRVRDRAMQGGMIAISGQDAAFGVVPPEEIIRLVNTIRAYDRPVRVQALAKKETRASGPLELDFRLR